jgi:hypothetical protein
MRKPITFFRHLVVASLATPLFFAGCKKKQEQQSTGSAAAPAAPTGSGSAPATPAPSTGDTKITAKRLGEDEGAFTKAIYYKDGIGQRFVHVAQNCDKFDCSYIAKKSGEDGTIGEMGGVNSDAVHKDCPKAKLLMIVLPKNEETKPGPVKVDVSVNDFDNPTDITNKSADGCSITEVTDKVVKGTLDLKSGVGETLPNAAANGAFTATVCP